MTSLSGRKALALVLSVVITLAYMPLNFTGTAYAAETIDLDDVIKVAAVSDQTYTGSAIVPEITMTARSDSFDVNSLVKDEDYEIVVTNNVDVGEATLKVKGQGNYTGTITKTFNIMQADIADAQAKEIADQMYTGEALAPEVELSLGDYDLKKDTDFTAAYSNNTEVGTAKVTATGQGNFKGTKEVEFGIYKAAAKIGDVKYRTVGEALSAAQAGDTVDILEAGTYTLPSSIKNITVKGKVDGVVFSHTKAGNISGLADGAAFENVTFNLGNVNYHGLQHAGKIVMTDCTINGKLFSYADMEFNGCTFNAPGTEASGVTAKDYSMWAYAGNVTYTDCKFNGAGKFINVYNEDGSKRYKVTASGCEFNSTESNKAAFNVKETCGSKVLKYDVEITDCTCNENFPAARESGRLKILSGLVQVDDRILKGTPEGGDIVVKVDGETVYTTPQIDYTAQIGETKYETLQAAIDAAHEMDGDVTVTLLKDTTEVVLVHQKAGLDLTIDGADKTLTGQIYVDGDGRNNGTDTLTIQNFKFAYDAATYDQGFVFMPSTKTAGQIYTTGKYNYSHNVTVKDCEFAGNAAAETVAVRNGSGAGGTNLVLDGLKETEGHSLAQITGMKNLTIKGCEATGIKNGINISGGEGTATITGNKVAANEAEGYTLRIKDNSGMAATLEDNTFSGGEGVVNQSKAGATISIVSGKYTGPLTTGNTGTIEVSGGVFDQKVAEANIAEGYVLASNMDEVTKETHPYTVMKAEDAVASVDGVAYRTFDAAATARTSDDDVITLLADIADEYTLAGGAMKVKKDGKALTVKAPEGQALKMETSGDVTTYSLAEPVASIGDNLYATLQDAIDAAHDMDGEVTVTLLADTTEAVVVHQKEGLDLTIDGGGKKLTGQIFIDGDGRFSGTDKLNIENFKFAYDAANFDGDTFINVPSTKTAGKPYTTNKYNYAHNVTVKDCEFEGEGTTTVAVRVASGAGANKLALNGLTVTGGHSFAQLTGVTDLTITGCEATGVKNGINVSGGDGTATITGNTVTSNETDGYTIRFKDGCGMAATLEDNTLSGGEGVVNQSTAGATVAIKSGKYTGPLTTVNTGTITVSGGVFDQTIAEANIAEGYVQTLNTDEATKEAYPYTVMNADDAVAIVNGIAYTSFDDAVAARKADTDLVTLLKYGQKFEYVINTAGGRLSVKRADGKSVSTSQDVIVTMGEALASSPSMAYALTNSTSSGVRTWSIASYVPKVEFTSTKGEVKYLASLSAAYPDNAVTYTLNTSGTYKLLTDMTTTQYINTGAMGLDVTIDLNGHDININNASSRLNFPGITTASTSGGKLAITGEGTITAVNSEFGMFSITGAKGTDLTIGKDVTIVTPKTGILINSNVKNGTVTIDGTIKSGDFALTVNGGQASADPCPKIIIGENANIETDDVAMYLAGYAETTINGGSITGTTAIYQKSGKLTINGGTFTGNGPKAEYQYWDNGCFATGEALVIDNCGYPGGEPIVEITGGKFIGENADSVGTYAYGDGNEPAEGFISGGRYSNKISDDLIVEGKTAIGPEEDDMYVVDAIKIAITVPSGGNATGESKQLTATINGKAPEEGQTITWTSSDETIATVDETGKVEFLKAGKVTITAAYKGAEATKSITVKDPVAEVDGVGYVTLSAAINAVKGTEGKEIKLLKDISETGVLCRYTVSEGTKFTLDLGGNKISANGASITINGADVTVKNGTIDIRGGNTQYFKVNSGSLTIEEDAEIDGHGTASPVSVFGPATINTEGTLTAENTFAIAGNGSAGKGGYTINVTGGKITSTGASAIYHPNDGTVNISGGEITGATAVYQKSGQLNISGGTLTGNGEQAAYSYNGNGANATGDAVIIDNCGYPGGAPKTSITGGTFISENANAVGRYAYGEGNEPVKAIISGGLFSDDKELTAGGVVEDYGLAATGDGMFYVAKSLKAAEAEVVPAEYTFTGEAIDPEAVKVTWKGEEVSADDVTFAVKEGEDNINVGTVTVVITPKADAAGRMPYADSCEATFAIAAREIKPADIQGVVDKNYTGQDITQNLSVVVDGKTLTTDDYTVEYANNKNVGTASVKVTGKGNYTGTAEATFQIASTSISKADASITGEFVYSGSMHEPVPVVKMTINGEEITLVPDADFTVSYMNNVEVGTASAFIIGEGGFTGGQVIPFEITPLAAEITVADIADQPYTGSEVTPELTVSTEERTLTEGEDYTVAFKNNVEAGMATATVTLKGNYTGTAEKTFKIVAVDKAALQAAIDAAADKKDGVKVSADGKDIDPEDTWTTLEERDELTAAIAAAKAVLDDPEATQAQVDAAAAAVTAAAEAFVPTAGLYEAPAEVDKDALADSITAAIEDRAATEVSEDGKDILPANDWVTQEVKDALNDAIMDAKAVLADSGATQEQVDAAKAAMDAAKEAFDAAKAKGTYEEPVVEEVDKAALEAAVEAAADKKDGVKVSADGKDIAKTDTWTTLEDRDALTEAIAAAQAVLNDPEATQAQVDAAAEAVTAAAEAFKPAAGTYEEPVVEEVDKTALEAAIDAAADKKDGVKVSADGKDIAKADTWTTLEERDELTAAIAAAKAVLDDPEATQAQVDAAAAAVTAAAEAFVPQAGTFEEPVVEEVDKTALAGAIADAIADRASAEVSKDGTDIAPSADWVTQAVKDALNDAIIDAKAVLNDSDATQAQVDAAKTAIDAAVEAFDDAKQKGTFAPSVVTPIDTSALEAAITAANTKKAEATAVSKDGTDVDPSDKWTTLADRDALTEAIAAARAALNSASDQDEVDKATEDLTAATAAFEPKAGTKVDPAPAVDLSELKASIRIAKAKMNGVKVSTNGSDIDPAEHWVTAAMQNALTEELAVAEATLANPDVTQLEVDADVNALNDEIDKYIPKNGSKAAQTTQPETSTITPGDATSTTPTEAEADKAPVNKAIPKVSKIKTSAKTAKKTMTIRFAKVKNAENYRIEYKKAQAKAYTKKWTNNATKYTLKPMKKNGLYQFRFAAYAKIGGKWQRGPYSNMSYRYFAKTTAKYSGRSKSIRVKIKRYKNATGYQIRYSTKSSMAGAKMITVKGNKNVTRTIRGLKKGKTYYVQVRPYKTYKGKKYLGILTGRTKVRVK